MRLNDKSKREKDEIRKRLGNEYGDGCLLCGVLDGAEYRKKHNKELDIHHIDENTENWEYKNLCLAHHGCNVRETPHGKIDHEKKYLSLSNQLKNKRMRSLLDKNIYADEAGLRISSLAEYKNDKLKPIADEEFEKIIAKEGEAEKESVLDAMANISGLTQQACRNYVKAQINPHNGEYEEFKKDMGEGEVKKYIRRKPCS